MSILDFSCYRYFLSLNFIPAESARAGSRKHKELDYRFRGNDETEPPIYSVNL
jgi:hypothetical protein